MMERMRLISAISVCVLAASGVAAAKDSSLSSATEHALQQSALTLPGSAPFHLKADISETSDPNSDDYKATIEEYWVSSQKWRRVITSQDFSQTLITNGDSISETDKGDYYPHWLSNFVTGVIDILPGPMVDAIKQSNAPPWRSRRPGRRGPIALIWRLALIGGYFVLRMVACLNPIFTKGSGGEYKDYKKFGNKWVARRVVVYPEPGTTVEARITELTDLTQPDDRMFEVQQPTPLAERIKAVRIDEELIRKLALGSTDIDWPTVGEGLLKGGCGVYVSADRSGQVREAIPEGCDNAALQGPLHDAVMKWHLRPAIVDGVRVQVEALMGIPFPDLIGSRQVASKPVRFRSEKAGVRNRRARLPARRCATWKDFTVQISVDQVENSLVFKTPMIFLLRFSS